MPTTHNEKHYRTDVVRLRRFERHERPYRSEEGEKRARKARGRRKSGKHIVGSKGKKKEVTNDARGREPKHSKEADDLSLLMSGGFNVGGAKKQEDVMEMCS